jgi:hypothetical protein
MKKRVIFTACVIGLLIPAILIATTIFIDYHYPPRKEGNYLSYELFKEFVKYYMQFLAVVVAGGILVQEYNRNAQKRESIKTFRRQTYKSVVDAYLKTKRIRTILRLNIIGGKLNTEVYRSEIEKLIEVKTSIEIIQHEIESNKEPFKDVEKQVTTALNDIESYLRNILREYHRYVSGVKRADTNSLDKLQAFLDPGLNGARSNFGIEYRDKVHQILSLLRKDKDADLRVFDLDLTELPAMLTGKLTRAPQDAPSM